VEIKDYKVQKDKGWARIHKNCLWWPYLKLWPVFLVSVLFVCDSTSVGDADVRH